MTDCYATYLTASSKREVPLNTIVLHSTSIPYNMPIKIPTCINKRLIFTGLYEDKDNELIEVPLNFIKVHSCHPYIDVVVEGLNTTPGQHDYQIQYVDILTDDISRLYFSYIVQNDNPEKPYIYMDESRKCVKEAF